MTDPTPYNKRSPLEHERDLADAPERIWIDPRGSRWVTRDSAQEDHGDVQYVRADLLGARIAELEAALRALL